MRMACQPLFGVSATDRPRYIRAMHGIPTCRRRAILLALAFTACSQAPEYRRPEVELPARWPSGGDGLAAPSAVAAHQLDWRNFFQDDRLRQLIATALDNNRDMRQAVARVEEARAQFGVIDAERLPALNSSLTRSASRTPGSLYNSRTDLKSQRYDLSVSMLSFEVDFWGRVASLSESAKATFLGTEEARRAARISLISDVANGYFALLQYDELIELSRRTLATRERSRELVILAQAAGAASTLDLLQIGGMLENARADLAALERQRSISENALTFLVGGMPASLPPGQTLAAQHLAHVLPVGLPSEVITARPDVLAAEQRLIAANANIGAARAAFLPRILLTAAFGLASPALATLFTPGNDTWNYQPSISLPLFDAGRNAGNVDLATARKNIAVADYEKTIQQAFRDISDLLAATGTIQRQMKSVTAVASIQNSRLEVEKVRQKAGAISMREVLEAERDLIGAQQTLAQLRYAQLTVATQLYKALGGGVLE